MTEMAYWLHQINLCFYLPELYRIFEDFTHQIDGVKDRIMQVEDLNALRLAVAVRWVRVTDGWGDERSEGILFLDKFNELADAVKRGVVPPR